MCRVMRAPAASVCAQDHSAVRAILREKDEQLYELRAENTELRAQVKASTEENVSLHNR